MYKIIKRPHTYEVKKQTHHIGTRGSKWLAVCAGTLDRCNEYLKDRGVNLVDVPIHKARATKWDR